MSFFGLGFTEVLVVCVVLLLVVGPAKLPDIARTVGKGFRTARRAGQELRDTLDAVDIRRAIYDDVREWPESKHATDAVPKSLLSKPLVRPPDEPDGPGSGPVARESAAFQRPKLVAAEEAVADAHTESTPVEEPAEVTSTKKIDVPITSTDPEKRPESPADESESPA